MLNIASTGHDPAGDGRALSFFNSISSEMDLKVINHADNHSLRSNISNFPHFLTSALIYKKQQQLQFEKNVVYPSQLKDLVELSGDYFANPLVFPGIKTRSGRYPSRSTRALISSIASVVLVNSCLKSHLIGSYTKGQHHPMAIIELARQAGFSYLDANRVEHIEPSWLRAYQLFSAGYIDSAQSRRQSLTKLGTKWQRSIKVLKADFFLHLQIHAEGEGRVPADEFQTLVSVADKRLSNYIGNHKDLNQRRSNWEASLNDANSPNLMFHQKNRNTYIDSLTNSRNMHVLSADLLAWSKFPPFRPSQTSSLN
jgi:hypothetical protein